MRTNYSFLVVTGYWIDDDWNLHETLLDFRHIQDRHTGELLASELFQILEYFDISDKLFCITADNAGNCEGMCAELAKILWNEKGIRWNDKERFIRCMNHVINLAVQDFLKNIKGLISDDMSDSESDDENGNEYSDTLLSEGFAYAMWKIRELTKKISSSNLRTERFQECCKFFKLPLLRMIYDVKTRWDSAYKMLARALFLRKAIDSFIDNDDDNEQSLKKYKLSKQEWNQAAVIVTILLPFKITSQRLQATKRPAIDSVFWDYESLFNKIDAIKETLNLPEYIDEEWI